MAPGGEHAVTAHDLAGVVIADDEMVAVFVEAVGVDAVAVSQPESRLGGEDVVPQALYGVDVVGVGGQQQGVSGTADVVVGGGDEYG